MKSCLRCGAAAEDDVEVCAECGQKFAFYDGPGAAIGEPSEVRTTRESEPSSILAWLFVAAGVGLIIWAIATDTSIDIGYGERAVMNISLAQRQLLLFIGGIGSVIIGTVMLTSHARR